MATPSGWNSLGTGPEGFVPNPEAHSPGISTNQPTKGNIKPGTDPDKIEVPYADRFETFTKTKWESLRTAYTIYHQIVWNNLLFYVGQLWIQWDKTRRVYQPAEPEDEYTPQPIVNYFSPAADAVSSIFKIPSVEAVAKKYTNEDAHDVAEIANVLAEEFKVRNGLSGVKDNEDNVEDRASQLFVLAGNLFGFVTKRKRGTFQKPIIDDVPMTGVRCAQCDTITKVRPDDPMLQPPPPSPGDMLMGQPVNGPGITPGQPPFQPSCPTCGQPLETYPTTSQVTRTDPITSQPITQPIELWDAQFKLGNPLYGLPRAGSRSMFESRYFMWAERMTIDEIYEEWGEEASPDNQFLDAMESSWEIALNYYYTGFTNMTESTKDSALVIICFIEPGKIKDVPEGGVGVLCGGRIIKMYTWEEYCPVGHAASHGAYLDVPVTFFGRTVMFDVADHQRELNRYEAIIALHGMTQASDSVIVDENTKVSEITGRGDRIVHWRSIGPGSQPPHRMQHGSLDNGVYEQRQKLLDNIQNITGAVNVWRGQQAGSVTASSAISQLRGQAEQQFSKPTNNWNNFWVENIRKGVKMMQLVMSVQQIADVVGVNHIQKITKFKAANIDDMLDWKPAKQGLPRTQDERQTEMLSLFDRGMLDVGDPNVQETINELFGDTGMKTMFNKDATRARWENGALSKGEKVQFMPDVEDLSVHLAIHGEFIKGLDFDQLEPPIQKMVLEHFMVTKMALTELMMAQAAMGGGGEGPGGPGGGPGAPPSSASGPGAPSGGHKGGPGEKGGPAKGRPGRAGGKTFQSAGQRKTGQSTTPTGPAPGGGGTGGGGA